MSKDSPKTIQSLQRAINILNCFNSQNPSLSVKEISQLLDLNINTTRGLINTLSANNLLTHNPVKNEYSLGLFFLGKSNLIQKQAEQYIRFAKSYARDIAEKYNICCSLQVVNDIDVYSVYTVYSSKSKYHITLSEYEALPVYATSSGKLVIYYNIFDKTLDSLKHIDFEIFTNKTIDSPEKLLTEMTSIQKHGYSCEIEEFSQDVASAAFPIVDSMNRLLYTISITTFSNHFKIIRKELTKELLEISAAISSQLFSPFNSPQ